jgi:hypothetical protein
MRALAVSILVCGAALLYTPDLRAQKPVLLGTPAGLMLTQVKPDRVKEFEAALAVVRGLLEKSSNPRRKAQGAGWKFYRAAEPLEGNVLYVFLLDPAVPKADYSLEAVLYGELPKEEATRVVRQFAQSIAGQNLLRLTPTEARGTPPPPAPAELVPRR